jgi:iron complex transport system ATP-binding protein
VREYHFTAGGLSVGYGGKPILRDIEIRLEKGRILTLIGPNGSGKSTILKSITRHLRLIGGEMSVPGIRLTGRCKKGYTLRDRNSPPKRRRLLPGAKSI